mgnify:CR=1 FL=1
MTNNECGVPENEQAPETNDAPETEAPTEEVDGSDDEGEDD